MLIVSEYAALLILNKKKKIRERMIHTPMSNNKVLLTLASFSQLMERYNIERGSPQRERSEDREEPRNHFDYRHLIPQVSIKTE